MFTDPPKTAIEAAISAALLSPCQKSARGAAVFHPGTTTVYGVGFNGQPQGFECTGSPTCRTNCGLLCVHAEQRAIRAASMKHWGQNLKGLEMLHVKVVGVLLVGGGGPSCWQCSREILDSGLSAMWLFEGTDPTPVWRRYTADEFHRVTLAACEIGG